MKQNSIQRTSFFLSFLIVSFFVFKACCVIRKSKKPKKLERGLYNIVAMYMGTEKCMF